MHPEKEFKFSDAWFNGFKGRYSISFRKPTNMSQHRPDDLQSEIRSFHKSIRRLGRRKSFQLSDIANTDQTPIPFSFMSGGTYADTGSKDISVQPAGAGLDKRQATVQITLFGDGVPRIKVSY